MTAEPTVHELFVEAITVPGALSGWQTLLQRFGTVGFKESFERAARIAEEGWGLAERRHAQVHRRDGILR